MTAHEALKTYFGYDDFRPLQEEIIQSVLDGRDTLALMPTGGGKSLCFQVPTMAMDGLCLVITPLIALMKDQVENLRKRDIHAAAIYTGMSFEQQKVALDNCQWGPYHFLYVSPERLESEEFRERLSRLPICLIAVDEAHCISQWGYDFRPSYLKIAEIREVIRREAKGERREVPILALTATATKSVAEDIMEKLSFRERNVISSGFERKNLSYVVRNVDDKFGNMLKVCNGVQGCGIVYVRERKRCEEISSFLRQNGITADFYHAGLGKDLRNHKQDAWKKDEIRVIVATNAFGMGIDKPDVRFVVHFDVPDSPEAYFQEAGRGGRDGKRSFAVTIWNSSDTKRLRQIATVSFPSLDYIEEIYHKVHPNQSLVLCNRQGNQPRSYPIPPRGSYNP